MTEQEYINVKELGYVVIIVKILQDITPEISECIEKGEFDEIYRMAYQWQSRLFSKIKTTQ